ncbi:MAG: DUF1289 domain-containing protein [Gammaproteobacteria bacterium]|nr:DUF1289 domain-containing protein [Gammaproteobacteria bacterium]
MTTSNTEIFESEALQPAESLCIDLCTLDDNDICVGCFRSIDEICAWAGAAEEQRRLILQAATDRRSGNGGRE